MKKPDPVPGLIVKYDYLWKEEYDEGQREGGKHHPCAVVSSSRIDENGDRKVLLCGISHNPLDDERNGVKVPAGTAISTGLDREDQWVRTDQYNEFKWSDPEIRPARDDRWEYGTMPQPLYDDMRQSVLEHQRQRTLTRIDRT